MPTVLVLFLPGFPSHFVLFAFCSVVSPFCFRLLSASFLAAFYPSLPTTCPFYFRFPAFQFFFCPFAPSCFPLICNSLILHAFVSVYRIPFVLVCALLDAIKQVLPYSPTYSLISFYRSLATSFFYWNDVVLHMGGYMCVQ
jgi:hypothetical protein